MNVSPLLLAITLPLITSTLPVLAQTPPSRSATQLAASPTSAPPAWSTLSPSQQAALQPLAPIWSQINGNRKRKWIALSANFGSLSANDQATLHGRMAHWASLSNAERNQARLNFAETRSLSSDEKKAQWQAYQALPPNQKQQLAQQAAKGAQAGAAPAVTNRSQGKLATVPVTRSDADAVKPRSSIAPARHPAPSASAATPLSE